jgi:hypothetical protein
VYRVTLNDLARCSEVGVMSLELITRRPVVRIHPPLLIKKRRDFVAFLILELHRNQ